MNQDTVWRWQLTPLQAFEGFTFSAYSKPDQGSQSFQLGPPFTSVRRPLEGTELTYQVAVSDCARTYSICDIRHNQPELETSGDRRSGVQVLEGDQVVASLIIGGTRFYQGQRLMVQKEPKDYRGQRLGQRLLLEWYKATKRPTVLSPQDLNPAGARSFLAAQIDVCRWALEQGKDVAPAVLSELETGVQEEEMLAVLREVERTGDGHTFQARTFLG